jgi:hypothetical protein
MNYWRCKCGRQTSWESGMPPAKCEGCNECNTTLAMYPDMHETPIEHDLEPRFNVRTGEPDGSICRRCHKRIKEND